ncbi:hypothetical protein CLV77_1113 [Brevirhabdus pacifica]|uniref:hypothetical protein n=2 Tax=Brevirhabdus pacifica TaxID=1267768 RepID=UPI000C24B4B7|nr:hypothetical protein [Brevirhabdus pacifica]PJJ86564.1 hypothetical protein CLV77_1113 [Brevirhabdus pacifica]
MGADPHTDPFAPVGRGLAGPHPINVLLIAHGALFLGFDYLPGALRTAAAGGLLVAYLGVILAGLRVSADPEGLGAGGGILPLAVLMGCWALAVAWRPEGHPPALEPALRQVATYGALLACLVMRSRIAPGVLLTLAVGVAISALMHALLLPAEYLNGRARLAPYSANLHSSGYGLVAAMLIVAHLSERGWPGRPLRLTLMAGLAILLLGNGVRTPLVFLACYILLVWVSGGRRPVLPSPLSVLALAHVVILVLLLLLLPGWERLDILASGRLANYAERFALLWQRGGGIFLVGTGPGSDLLRTGVWWWEEKDSHSDLLKILWEGGLVGFLAMLWFWVSLAMRHGGTMMALSGAVLLSSAISNGYLARPNPAFLLFACAAARLAWQEGRGASRPAA